MSLSLIPSKWARIITPINSIRFSLTAHRIRAAAVPACAVSSSGVGVIIFTSPSSVHKGNLCDCLVSGQFEQSNSLLHQVANQYKQVHKGNYHP
ncbi:MAG: hypothetical protein [Circular genetic element sp.]|nr:MAG: hypothetical protein [Circular genetic element sp.]